MCKRYWRYETKPGLVGCLQRVKTCQVILFSVTDLCYIIMSHVLSLFLLFLPHALYSLLCGCTFSIRADTVLCFKLTTFTESARWDKIFAKQEIE